MNWRAQIACIVVALSTVLVGCGPHFSDSAIPKIKAVIKSNFEKQEGLKVSDIQLIRESPRKLTGYVVLKIEGTDIEATKPCSVTMGDDGNVIWHCE